jgi:hypothetical protein
MHTVVCFIGVEQARIGNCLFHIFVRHVSQDRLNSNTIPCDYGNSQHTMPHVLLVPATFSTNRRHPHLPMCPTITCFSTPPFDHPSRAPTLTTRTLKTPQKQQSVVSPPNKTETVSETYQIKMPSAKFTQTYEKISKMGEKLKAAGKQGPSNDEQLNVRFQTSFPYAREDLQKYRHSILTLGLYLDGEGRRDIVKHQLTVYNDSSTHTPRSPKATISAPQRSPACSTWLYVLHHPSPNLEPTLYEPTSNAGANVHNRARPSTTSGRRSLTPAPARRRLTTSTSSWASSFWPSTTNRRIV